MTQRTTLERNTPAADQYGPAGTPNWAVAIANLACWLYSPHKAAVSEILDTRKVASVEDLRMLVPRGTDVTEKDRFNVVTDRRGRVIRAGLLAIEEVVFRHDHLELAVRSVEP